MTSRCGASMPKMQTVPWMNAQILYDVMFSEVAPTDKIEIPSPLEDGCLAVVPPRQVELLHTGVKVHHLHVHLAVHLALLLVFLAHVEVDGQVGPEPHVQQKCFCMHDTDSLEAGGRGSG
jgi:hypothetical protein